MKKGNIRIKLILTMFLIVGSIINGIVITLYNVDKSANLSGITREMIETKNNLNSLNESISASDSLVTFLGKSGNDGFVDNPQVLYFNQADSLAQVR